MTAPRIILSAGPQSEQSDTIVIDVRTSLLWRGAESRPHYSRSHPLTRRTTFRIFSALLLSAPRLLPHEDLYDFVWGDDPDGGPEDPRLSVATHIGRPSGIDLMNWLGGSVVSRFGHGYFWEFGRPYQPKFSRSAAGLQRRYRAVQHELARAS